MSTNLLKKIDVSGKNQCGKVAVGHMRKHGEFYSAIRQAGVKKSGYAGSMVNRMTYREAPPVGEVGFVFGTALTLFKLDILAKSGTFLNTQFLARFNLELCHELDLFYLPGLCKELPPGWKLITGTNPIPVSHDPMMLRFGTNTNGEPDIDGIMVEPESRPAGNCLWLFREKGFVPTPVAPVQEKPVNWMCLPLT